MTWIYIWILKIGCVLRRLLQLRNKGSEGSGRKTSERRLNAIRSRTRGFVPTLVLRKGSELAWDKLAKKSFLHLRALFKNLDVIFQDSSSHLALKKVTRG